MVRLDNFYIKEGFKKIPHFARRLREASKTYLSHNLGRIGGVGAGVLVAYFIFDYMGAPHPTISIQAPSENQSVLGERLYVSGVVKPVGSRVSVNGKVVAQNGDGSFTAVITIPEGKNNLKIEAKYKGKKSELVTLVTRELTEEEKKKQDDERKLTDIKSREKVLGVDQKIDELIAAYDNPSGEKFIKVISHELIKEMEFKRVKGEVVNTGKVNTYWVKATANFYDEKDNLVDSKIGFVVALDKALAPGEKGQFETQSTTKEFVYYKLVLDWKSGINMTEQQATVSGSPLEASSSSKK